MARALYSEAELIILDDSLSGLDRETASTVRLRLFSESDILESGMTTIIMTTSISKNNLPLASSGLILISDC